MSWLFWIPYFCMQILLLFFFPQIFGKIYCEQWGRAQSLAAAFLMAAKMMLSSSLFLFAQMCVPTLFLMNLGPACPWRPWAAPWLAARKGRSHTLPRSCPARTCCVWWDAGGGCALACSWSPCDPCWGPGPWGSAEPWLLFYSSCCGGSCTQILESACQIMQKKSSGFW